MAKRPAKPAASAKSRPAVTDHGEMAVTTTTARGRSMPKSPELLAKKKTADGLSRDEVERNRVLGLARQRVVTASERWQERFQAMRSDRLFRLGSRKVNGEFISLQWPEYIQRKRIARGLPCLTINRGPGFVRQVTNGIREADLRAIVRGVDDDSDPKVAEVIQGLLRNTEQQSNSDRCIITAAEAMADMGLGWAKLRTDWADTRTFRQTLRWEQVLDPLQVLCDDDVVEPGWSDMRFLFHRHSQSEAEFEYEFGIIPPRKDDIVPGLGALEPAEQEVWFGDGDKRVTWFEYYALEHNVFDLYDVPDFPEGLRQGTIELLSKDNKPIVRYNEKTKAWERRERRRWLPVRTREVFEPVVVIRKLCATGILEETEWPGTRIPYFPCIGQYTVVDGIRDLRGVIRDYEDAQRVYNVAVTAAVEIAGLGTKAPWIGYRGAFGEPNSDQRRKWETANWETHAYLEAGAGEDPTKPLPLPQRNLHEPPIQANIMLAQQADNDMKSTSQFFDASLGERGPQESGKAILARQRQDERGSAHYLDNVRFMVAEVGRESIEVFRRIYDHAQVARITNASGKDMSAVVFSGKAKDPRRIQGYEPPKKAVGVFDIDVGTYDVEVTGGKNEGTRRQEGVEAMTALMGALPPDVSMKFLDLYFLLMDFPMARQMADRVKAMVPEAQDADEGEVAIPPQVKAEVERIRAQAAELMAALQEAQAIIQGKQLENATKENIAALNAWVKIIELLTKEEHQDRRVLLEAQLQQVQTFLSNARERIASLEANANERETFDRTTSSARADKVMDMVLRGVEGMTAGGGQRGVDASAGAGGGGGAAAGV